MITSEFREVNGSKMDTGEQKEFKKRKKKMENSAQKSANWKLAKRKDQNVN